MRISFQPAAAPHDEHRLIDRVKMRRQIREGACEIPARLNARLSHRTLGPSGKKRVAFV